MGFLPCQGHDCRSPIFGGSVFQVISQTPLSSYFVLGCRLNSIDLFLALSPGLTLSSIETTSHVWLLISKSIKIK